MQEYYQIRVRGHLDLSWSGWFDGLTITHDDDGCSTIAGMVVDQAALYGLLAKARDLGLNLVGVTLVGRAAHGLSAHDEERSSR